MLVHPVVEQLKSLRWQGVLEAYLEQLGTPDINCLPFDERLALLIERECLVRENRKLTNRLRQAKLKEQACIEDIDYTSERQLSKTVISRLAECSWLVRKKTCLLLAPQGVGKHIWPVLLPTRHVNWVMVRATLGSQNCFRP